MYGQITHHKTLCLPLAISQKAKAGSENLAGTDIQTCDRTICGKIITWEELIPLRKLMLKESKIYSYT